MDTKNLDHDGRNIDDHAKIVEELLDDIIFSSISEFQSNQVSTFITKTMLSRIRNCNSFCIFTDDGLFDVR